MASALIVRFRPDSLWRIGPDNGARDRAGYILHSDTLFSAVTVAMGELGWADQWLAAAPDVRLSSCYPYVRRELLIQPPSTVWPPSDTGKVRWKAARFVPVSLVPRLLRHEDLDDEQWVVDPASKCLLPLERNSTPAPPFRFVMRAGAAVDRMTGASADTYSVAGIQFTPGSGMWFAAAFEAPIWADRLRAAARLLADTGIGGRRAQGWGHSAPPRFEDLSFADLFGGQTPDTAESAWWLLSLFRPGEQDSVDWKRGNYRVITRFGRALQDGRLKPAGRLLSEGSVVLSASMPVGSLEELAIEDAGHRVVRSGVALAVRIPWRESQRLSWLAGERPAAEPPAAGAPGEQPVVDEEPAAAPDEAAEIWMEPESEEAPGAEPGEELPDEMGQRPDSEAERQDEPEPDIGHPPVEEPPEDERPAPETRVSAVLIEQPVVHEEPTRAADEAAEIGGVEQQPESEAERRDEPEPDTGHPPVEEPPEDERRVGETPAPAPLIEQPVHEEPAGAADEAAEISEMEQQPDSEAERQNEPEPDVGHPPVEEPTEDEPPAGEPPADEPPIGEPGPPPEKQQ